MRTSHPWLLMVALAACSGGDGKDVAEDGDTVPDGGDADTDADSDSDTDADCTAVVTSVTPADGDNFVPLDAEVTATLSAAITDADPFEITVGDAQGTTTLASDGLSMTWVGTLDAETDYTITANACDSSFEADIHTLPESIDLASLEGNTYAIPWQNIDIDEPSGQAVEGLLNTFITIDYVLAQILTVDAGAQSADSIGTTGVEGEIDIEPQCDAAVEQTADFTLNPYFRIEGDIQIPVDPENGVFTTVEDFSLLARMDEGGGSISDIRIHGLIATEDLLANNDCNSAGIALLVPTCLPCAASATGECMLFEGTAELALLQPTLDIDAICPP
jgi:hypothetical protein